MFKNYIKLTFRNIGAHKLYYAINIFGLAVGIVCALIITLYINHELSFDRFHSNYQSIYRVTLHGQLKGTKFDGATTSAKMATHISSEIESVNDITRITRLGAWLIAKDTVRYNEDNLLFVDSNFLNFFDGFILLEGNVDSMLVHPRSIVLTKSTALKYFGTIHSVVGQKLKVETNDKLYVVTGIVENPPTNSHMQFDMLASFSTFEKLLTKTWTSNNVYTYVKINQKSELSSVNTYINSLFNKYIRVEMVNAIEDIFQPDDEYGFSLQPLTSIHLNSSLEAELQTNGKAIYVYSLGIIAILILITACLNFMNLSTANSSNRSFEVSLRKIVGADKRYLIAQFLVESVVISLISLIFALLLAELLLPYFNRFLSLSLEFRLFENLRAVSLILVITTGMGILAGSYPAYFISTFDPVQVINGKYIRGLRNSKIRSVFVFLQFFISILVITLTIVVYAQVNYMINKDMGFDNEDILVIRRSDALGGNIDQFKSEIGKNSHILSATNSNSIPGRDFYLNTFKLKGKSEDAALLFNQLFVNYDYFETFNLKLNQGRFFNPKEPTDTFAVVINKSAADFMGLSYPIGSELLQPNIMKNETRIYKVIGVVEDFHFQSLNEKINPLIICLMPGNWEGYLNVKIKPHDKIGTISSIEKIWYKYAPDYPFVYFFLNEDFNKNYDGLLKLGRVFIVFSILSIFVSCLGLYGLIVNAANQRIREMAIRKSMGASLTRLISILAGETIKLILISTAFSWLAAYLLIRYLLNDFYYKVQISPIYFVSSLALLLLLALPTVIYYSLKSAQKNPGGALKYE